MNGILDELDDVSKVCLKSTSCYFRSAIKIDIVKLSVCSRWMLLCRFETDYYALMQAYPPRVACALCKVKVRQECIQPKKYRNIHASSGAGALEPMLKEPIARCCVLHAPYLFRLSGTNDPYKNDPAIFTKKSELKCMHCDRNTTHNDGRSVGCDVCQCSVCPRAIQPVYELSGYHPSSKCHFLHFTKDFKTGNGLTLRDLFSNALSNDPEFRMRIANAMIGSEEFPLKLGEGEKAFY